MYICMCCVIVWLQQPKTQQPKNTLWNMKFLGFPNVLRFSEQIFNYEKFTVGPLRN